MDTISHMMAAVIIVLNFVVSSWPASIWPNAFLGDSRRKSACPVCNTNEIHMQKGRYTIMNFDDDDDNDE